MTARTCGSGSFFAVNRRTWARICDSLEMNEAVAYLVLACGTGRDNLTTSWSSQALHKYTGIAWERGKAAIERLRHAGFIKFAESHTQQRPRYELVPHKGAIGENEADNSIWLPNSIVTGTPSGEIPPVHQLRSTGDAWTLRLLVDLYHAQNLRDDGGISPQILRENYAKKRINERSIYLIWGFKSAGQTLSWKGPFAAHQKRTKKAEEHPVWDSVRLLNKMGLLTFVPHLYENSSAQAEPIHALGIGAKGEEPIETQIGEAADAAARAMCQEWAIEQAEDDGFKYFCPVSQSKPDAQLIGVARLLYRPRTQRTAAWYAHLQASGNQAFPYYEELARGKTLCDDVIAKRA